MTLTRTGAKGTYIVNYRNRCNCNCSFDEETWSMTWNIRPPISFVNDVLNKIISFTPYDSLSGARKMKQRLVYWKVSKHKLLRGMELLKPFPISVVIWYVHGSEATTSNNFQRKSGIKQNYLATDLTMFTAKGFLFLPSNITWLHFTK